MSTNRELLELAAKAAGIDHPGGEHSIHNDGRLWDCKALRWWNPLTDDGDALRLAVKLSLDVVFQHEAGGINRACKLAFVESASPWEPSVREEDVSDPNAATRRAIVRAAAAIGEQHA